VATKTEDWKKRYFEEAREWEGTDRRLRRALGRLAIAATGHSADLDEALGRVQAHAKAGRDAELDKAVDEVSNIVRSAPVASADEASPPPLADTGPSAVDLCTTLLDGLETDAEQALALRELQRRLPGLPPERCAAELARELSVLLRQAVRAPEVAGGGSVQDVLFTLIDEVAVVQPGLGSLKTLRDRLRSEGAGDWNTVLSRIIGEIRGIIQRINADKQALETLVQDVSRELGDITGVLRTDLASITSGREQTERLHELMDEGVSRIQAHIETESDIERLKEGVSQSLGHIRSAITEFAEGDAERLAAAQARNEELQQRVSRMEAESEQLQETLKRNREQLLRDALTGARSRLAYDESLAQELGRYRRYGKCFCLAVLDIDHFKNINDSYGHAAGDKALKLVATKVGSRLRETDLLFRTGGEEFVLLLPDTELDAAGPLVEAVRGCINEAPFHFEGTPVTITLSAGVTAVRDEDTAETIFARADDAMYRAKKTGRNRLVTLD
jgi:diguanylate cyclase